MISSSLFAVVNYGLRSERNSFLPFCFVLDFEIDYLQLDVYYTFGSTVLRKLLLLTLTPLLLLYSTSHVLGTFCGTSRPYPVYSTGRYLRVTLHGSKSGLDTRHTFRAQYTNVDSTPAAPAGM